MKKENIKEMIKDLCVFRERAFQFATDEAKATLRKGISESCKAEHNYRFEAICQTLEVTGFIQNWKTLADDIWGTAYWESQNERTEI